MRIVVALGGNAISRRGEEISVENQRRNIREACGPLTAIAEHHELVVTHGNGPQVGLLALQNAAYTEGSLYPLDTLGAESQGLIGYLIELELRNALLDRAHLTTVLTLVEVDPTDPAFSRPTKFVGPVYTPQQARSLARERGWTFAMDGKLPRRVVPSPVPERIIQVDAVRSLLGPGQVVVCTGGGGIPVARAEDGTISGVEAVVDKDASSAVLAREIDADALVLATDADAVHVDWGTPNDRRIAVIGADTLDTLEFPAGSMGPKVEAATAFVRRSGHAAYIGRLQDVSAMLEGTTGTRVVPGDAPAELV